MPKMPIHESDMAETSALLRVCAKSLDQAFNGDVRPKKVGFVLLVTPFDGPDGARTSYISNVARKDVENNILYVVQGHDHPWLLSGALASAQASWIAGEPPSAGQLAAKTRYRQADVPCTIAVDGDERFSLSFPTPQWAVTPGQSAVLYDGEVCLGGGIINTAIA